MKNVLITGSGGLIGSESAKYFCNKNYNVYGIDNGMRSYFFGKDADTTKKYLKLNKEYTNYKHYEIDIRDQKALEKLFKSQSFDLIIHTAAQPSHDWAAKEPITDFTINALGTLYLLENFKKYSPEGVFIFTSTNKVYGDLPNNLPFIEQETRYELPSDHSFYKGIDESMSIDQSKHSLFGASKISADILVQEYGRYFNLNTVSFRCGCLSGPAHSGAKLHGFLAYLAKCIYLGDQYTVLGYKGKQVRDNIHSYDLVNAFYHFFLNPKKGAVYNMGGSRYSNISMLEAIDKIQVILNKKAKLKYQEEARAGDHIWYISDIKKFRDDYPKWDFHYSIDKTIEEICMSGNFR